MIPNASVFGLTQKHTSSTISFQKREHYSFNLLKTLSDMVDYDIHVDLIFIYLFICLFTGKGLVVILETKVEKKIF